MLPGSGYKGRLPGLNQFVPKPTARQREVWTQLWRTPQATVWIREPWRWPVVAELARLQVLTEQDHCMVGIWQAIRQRRDDLGLSTHGQRVEGWEIATGISAARPVPPDELGQHRERRVRRSQNLHQE